MVDSDNDGWSDVWKAIYGRSFTPDGDADNDGRTNWEEHEDGTNPNDLNSRQDGPVVTKKATAYTVQWSTVPGKMYQLEVGINGEWMKLGSARPGTGEKVTVSLPGTTTRFRGAKWSRWFGAHNAPSAVRAKATGGVAPEDDDVQATLEIPQTVPNADSFGQWVRGWILPPAAGKYTFYIAGDDASELWLSTTANAAGKKLIASSPSWTALREWTKYPSQKSVPITLRANQPVYFEIFHLEWTGADHLSVAWTGPKVGNTPVILDENVLLTRTETLTQMLAKDRTPEWRLVVTDKDTDGDGISDYEELLVGLDPNNPTSTSGVDDLATLQVMLAPVNTVTVGAQSAGGYQAGGAPVRFVFTRSGNLNPVTIHYTVAGVATGGEAYAPVSGSASLPASQNTATIDLLPTLDDKAEAAASLTVTVQPDTAYQLGAPSSATVTKVPDGGPTSTTARSDSEAARFLTQTTFGPTVTDIAALRKVSFADWITVQTNAAPTPHLPYVQARRASLLAQGVSNSGGTLPRQEAWWQAALAAPDQLRQRMAFALSELMVVSEVATVDPTTEGMTNYYDLLVKNAFGNYRTLLEEVALSPIMGQYLSMVRNQKPDPATGSQPDENLAREIMQLFSIGLTQLNADGSPQLDANGAPLPTYTQDDIAGLARVFTGWGYAYDTAHPPTNLRNHFLWGTRDEMHRMVQFPEFHDTTAKRIVGGVAVPAGLTGEAEMKIALDTLAAHPNVPPFIARHLIQRFVTSNPSRDYVRRVATAFSTSGGNLGAALRAVLLDPEARNPAQPLPSSYGKLREPLLRMSHLLRALNTIPPRAGDPNYYLDTQFSFATQAALKSPTVFNFFTPGYTQPGVIAQAGLVAPEFQVTTETSVINQTNLLNLVLLYGHNTREKNASGQNLNVKVNLAEPMAIVGDATRTLAENQTRLIDYFNILLLNGQMSPGLRTVIANQLAPLGVSFGMAEDRLRVRVQVVVFLIISSPEYCVQK